MLKGNDELWKLSEKKEEPTPDKIGDDKKKDNQPNNVKDTAKSAAVIAQKDAQAQNDAAANIDPLKQEQSRKAEARAQRGDTSPTVIDNKGQIVPATRDASGNLVPTADGKPASPQDTYGKNTTGLKSGNFDAQAPEVMSKLQKDFGLTKEQAAGVVGNLGHESAGLKAGIQEGGVKKGRGGLGWAQWTGPRRVAFEKYLKETGQSATDPNANYGFLKQELQTTHKGALTAVKKTSTAADSMKAFEQKYEAAGVKHYESRQKYTDRALALANKGTNVKDAYAGTDNTDAKKVAAIKTNQKNIDDIKAQNAQASNPNTNNISKASTTVQNNVNYNVTQKRSASRSDVDDQRLRGANDDLAYI